MPCERKDCQSAYAKVLVKPKKDAVIWNQSTETRIRGTGLSHNKIGGRQLVFYNTQASYSSLGYSMNRRPRSHRVEMSWGRDVVSSCICLSITIMIVVQVRHKNDITSSKNGEDILIDKSSEFCCIMSQKTQLWQKYFYLH